jgi:hypothetical protein
MKPKLSDVESLGWLLVTGFGLYIVYQVVQGFKSDQSVGTTIGSEVGDFITGVGNAIQAPFNAWLDGS